MDRYPENRSQFAKLNKQFEDIEEAWHLVMTALHSGYTKTCSCGREMKLRTQSENRMTFRCRYGNIQESVLKDSNISNTHLAMSSIVRCILYFRRHVTISLASYFLDISRQAVSQIYQLCRNTTSAFAGRRLLNIPFEQFVANVLTYDPPPEEEEEEIEEPIEEDVQVLFESEEEPEDSLEVDDGANASEFEP
ncbi:hypothetical protein BLNAU_13133 [Blattamonas nauphoetae]|uniref:Transposase n=1 Tax=Blattamonas nauphoetae TaxID=2049346 RepID=A0ABQ9XMQ2_9EUKA|nr:hypothetical protein BLNAU_13133 [Blattamonas nauphoetae]